MKKIGENTNYPLHKAWIICLSILLLLVVFILSLRFGSRDSSFSDLLSAFFGGVFPRMSGKANEFTLLVIKERMPRTVFSLLAGASLGISGLLMQTVTKNPIADPGIMGVNMGASFAVVIGMVFFNMKTSFDFIIFALVGAFLTSAFVYMVASIGPSGPGPIKLALAGSATALALSSLVSMLILPNNNVMDQFRFWQVGSVGRAEWDGIMGLLPFLLVGWILAFYLSSSLNVLALGDDIATGLGVKIVRTRFLAALAASILCGSVTAIGGPIGFIGLMVPHLVQILIGPDIRWSMPISALFGAILLTASDVLGRVIARPAEVEVGIVTAIIGAPILIWVSLRIKKGLGD
ncbi:MAG: iron ABC transporter permease [Finegoldia magna]|uniref:FecCD family ABC transporter permease n=1 Tax=Finegoldia magna TaxID=1260 RepID=UPI0028FE077C|nr:iron ABC transporter permease [Finegoldia magna]MDU2131082.1 iron ABC transporter permease [Finegoldia magna]MDU5223791.1 iron ABC transporter permease [Finegoldia magna]